MNVLDATRTPLVMSLPQVLRAWLDHRHEGWCGARGIGLRRSIGGSRSSTDICCLSECG